jgi:hypothetical protein
MIEGGCVHATRSLQTAQAVRQALTEHGIAVRALSTQD